MYGTDEETTWYDYDLVSAYTTAMSDLSLPFYALGYLMSVGDFYELIGQALEPCVEGQVLKPSKNKPSKNKPTKLELLFDDYYIINATFEFPKNVKYPSIPCYIDETTTIYPLTGSCLLTGPEYVLARNQGCNVKIKSVFHIPSRTEDVVGDETTSDKDDVDDDKPIKPFYAIIEEIQRLRGEHPKGSIMNLLYKEMGNSVYGNVVRGMSNKKCFDSLTGQYVKMTATELSNPVLAS